MFIDENKRYFVFISVSQFTQTTPALHVYSTQVTTLARSFFVLRSRRRLFRANMKNLNLNTALIAYNLSRARYRAPTLSKRRGLFIG